MMASTNTVVPRVKNTVYSEIVSRGIPEDVARAANDIYNKSGKHISGNVNKSMRLIYECCYNGYITLGVRPDPVALGKKFGVSAKKSVNARAENIYIEPSVHVDECVEILSEYDDFDDVILDPEMIKELSTCINAGLPPVTAALAGTAVFVLLLDKAAPEWWDKMARSHVINTKGFNNTQVKKAIGMFSTTITSEIDRIVSSYTFEH